MSYPTIANKSVKLDAKFKPRSLDGQFFEPALLAQHHVKGWNTTLHSWIMFTLGTLGRHIGRYIGRYVGRVSIDSRSIVDRHIDRLMTDTWSRVDRLSTDVATDCRSIFRWRFATKYRSYVGGISVKCRWYIGKPSVICRPTVGRVSRVDLNVFEV